MSFYHDCVVPYLLHLSMRQKILIPYRQRVLTKATGRILEIGFGSGLNLPFETRKLYQILPDREAARERYIRVVDESGEDHIYPSDLFVPHKNAGDRGATVPWSSACAKNAEALKRISCAP